MLQDSTGVNISDNHEAEIEAGRCGEGNAPPRNHVEAPGPHGLGAFLFRVTMFVTYLFGVVSLLGRSRIQHLERGRRVFCCLNSPSSPGLLSSDSPGWPTP